MATPLPLTSLEGQSVSRPPLFNGSNYSYWKTRMENFMKSVDINCWRNVITGPRIPMKVVGDELVRKTEEEYTDADWNDIAINAKAINILHCALDATEYNKVSGCKSATEVWEKPRVTYEGTDRVKDPE